MNLLIESIPFRVTEDLTRRAVRRQVPKIDGSQGAFIGLVVALSVLIIVCCGAVFYLLRHHEPTDQERVARRERHRRAREQVFNSNSSSASGGLGSLGNTVKRLWWQSSSGAGRGRRGGRGWIRAGSDDEWASHSDHGGDSVGRGNPSELGGRLRALGTSAPEEGARVGIRTGPDNIRVVESPSSDTASTFGSTPYVYGYADPFLKTTTPPHAGLHRSQSPLSSPTSSPRGSASADGSQEAHSPRDDPRHRSAMSHVSVWSQAGSKFVEDI